MFSPRILNVLLFAALLLVTALVLQERFQTARAAAQSDCLVEVPSLAGQKLVADANLTAACKQRVAEGWKLVGFSMGGFVWVK